MKKKIVILSAFLTPFRSGAEACAEEVPLALADQFDFTIVTARLRKDLPRESRLGPTPDPPPSPLPEGGGAPYGVRVLRIGIGYPVDKWLFPFLAPFAVRRLKPDIVHAVLETFAGLALVFCEITTRARRILTCQTTNRSFLKRLIVRSPDTVTVISTALQTIVAGLGRPDAMRIPNGIHVSAFRTVQKKQGSILFVGRLEKMKGIDTLLRAFSRLSVARCPSDPDFVRAGALRIVGDGSERKHLEDLAKQLGIADRVTFVGRVDPGQVVHEFEKAQIFCGLSRSEALGNVFLEAQAAGCAVVATNVGGIPDIVEHEKTGLLIEPDDVEAAAQAISRVLDNDALCQQLAEAGRKNAAAYDWRTIAQRYNEIYA